MVMSRMVRSVAAGVLVLAGIGLLAVAGWAAGLFGAVGSGPLFTALAVAGALVGTGFLALAAAVFWLPLAQAVSLPVHAPQEAGDSTRYGRFSPWRSATKSLVAALGGTLGFLAISGWVISTLDHHLQLPLLIVVLLIGLLSAIAFVVIAFGIFRLVDRTQALGLPPGSVQAIIALSLILLFVTLTVFLVLQMKNRQPTDPSVDVAKQVLTVLGTLVTAVSAFYFGSRSTTDAVRTTPAGGGGPDGTRGGGGTPDNSPGGGQQAGGAGTTGTPTGGPQAGGASTTGTPTGGQQAGGGGAAGPAGGVQQTGGAGAAGAAGGQAQSGAAGAPDAEG